MTTAETRAAHEQTTAGQIQALKDAWQECVRRATASPFDARALSEAGLYMRQLEADMYSATGERS